MNSDVFNKVINHETRTSPDSYEIDIGEMHYHRTIFTSYWNWLSSKVFLKQKQVKTQCANKSSPLDSCYLDTNWHILTLKWTPKEMVWFLDGTQIYDLPNDYAHSPLQVRFSTAVLNNGWAGTPSRKKLHGKSMDVDWVRVYQFTGEGEAPPTSCTGGGLRVDGSGACWYLGELGHSCEYTCRNQGGYHADTLEFTGSNGSLESCAAVLNALSIKDRPEQVVAGSALGCGLASGKPQWRIGKATTPLAWWSGVFKRVCACTN